MDNLPKPRRPHTKSRLGCFSCKKRHLRCDLGKPQCHNCADRGYDCDFPTPKVKSKDEVPVPFVLSSKGEHEHSQDGHKMSSSSSIVSSTNISLPPRPSSPYNFTATDLQFVHHFVMTATEIQTGGGNQKFAYGTLLPIILSLSLSHDMVKDAMMAFAASHLGWLANSDRFHARATGYQTSAYRRLRRALGSFSRETADAVFAATSILLWQAPEWTSWSSLVQGSRAVIESMRPWARTSVFSSILLWNIQEIDANRALGPLPEPNDHDRARLDRCISCLKEAENFMRKSTATHLTLYNTLLNFVQDLRDNPPGPTAAEQFKTIFPLRGWIFIMPTAIFGREVNDVNHLVAFSLYNATVLAIKHFFPAAGQVFFRILHVEPIREIHKYLVYTQCMGKMDEDPDLKEMMDEAVRLTGLAVEIADF